MPASDDARVGIVSAGARTAVGRSLPSSAAAVRAGIANVGRHPFLGDRLGHGYKVARATWLPINGCGAARLNRLAVNAAKEALAPLVRLPDRGARMRVFIGVSEPRPGRPAGLDGEIARAFWENKLWGDLIDEIVLIPRGHAAGLVAIERAAALVRATDADLCLAGGVDGYLEVDTMRWLERSDRLRTTTQPWGMIPGEAAGFCLLASSRWLDERGLHAPLSLVAAASADEPAPARTGKVCTGVGLSAAFDGALEPLRADGTLVDALIGDLNGDPYRADELGFALARTADGFASPGNMLVPTQSWGDVGAASGPLFAGLAFAAATRDGATRETTLIWGSSEGSLRASAVLSSHPAGGEPNEP